MKIFEAIETIKAAIDNSSEQKSDGPWANAVEAAGLVAQNKPSDVSRTDEDYVRAFGTVELRVNHTCRDTSKTFQMRPDVTVIKLELVQNGKVIDSYANGYQS
ncbi:hypothetical protein DSM25558_4370 [Agrobacterium sp. DSM 25558]|uniref:hypothetical protein n=1 Tax=Agrobacterium sp. DSM 25558 TaxID=1907665 RepID=UPI00097256C4|nr:hypothetical protein [Agrobacterium sp. DSM 25558]SCX28093.1 hypothetical protein DSM25558_4370 [Agrobacterium sp. DSM 25558]